MGRNKRPSDERDGVELLNGHGVLNTGPEPPRVDASHGEKALRNHRGQVLPPHRFAQAFRLYVCALAELADSIGRHSQDRAWHEVSTELYELAARLRRLC